jgi:hypothetical protein
MKTHEIPTDRNQALRAQLVAMPIDTAPGKFNRRKTQKENTFPQPNSPRRKTRAIFALAAAGVGLVVVGQLNVTIQSAHASEVLRATAEKSMNFTDPVPGTGQYLLVSTHANWLTAGDGTKPHLAPQNIDVYVPSDANQEWVLDRDWGDKETRREVVRAQHGDFYDSPWTVVGLQEMDAMPRDGKALYELFNSQYQGGSASRNEDNFVRITDLLRTGMIPADLRAGLYEALALVPGVSISENQKNSDGRSGTAIGRTEALRGGERSEILIDPNTGLVIGERDVMTIAAFGFGINNVTGHTAIDYQIVDSIPK